MFQPASHQVPTQYDLMPMTLNAMVELSGRSQKPIHYTQIDAWIVGAYEIPDETANYKTPNGREPLLKIRLAQARSHLRRDAWIRQSEIPGKSRGYWCLTPRTLRIRATTSDRSRSL